LVGFLLVELLIGLSQRREREGELVDRLGKAVEQLLPCISGPVGHRLLAYADGDRRPEGERIGACAEFAGSSERLYRPATLLQRVVTGAQRYSVSDRSQCAGRRA